MSVSNVSIPTSMQQLDLSVHATSVNATPHALESPSLLAPSPGSSHFPRSVPLRANYDHAGNILRYVSKNLNEVNPRKIEIEMLEKRMLSNIGAAKVDLKSRMEELDRQMDGAFGYVDSRMDVMFVNKICAIDEHLAETLSLLDTRVEDRLREFDNSITWRLTQFQVQIEEEHKERLNSNNFRGIVNSMIDSHLSKKEVDIQALLSTEAFKKAESQVESITNAFILKHEALKDELDDVRSSVTFLSSKDVIFGAIYGRNKHGMQYPKFDKLYDGLHPAPQTLSEIVQKIIKDVKSVSRG